MKVSEMIQHLKTLQDQYGDLDLVYAKDDEGNGFYWLYHEPSVGFYDSKGWAWYPYDDEEYSLEYKSGEFEINTICIN